MNGAKRCAIAGFAVGALGLFSATDGDAQVCVGFPTGGGQMAAAVTANFPTGGNMFGGEFNYNFQGPLSAFLGLVYTDPDIGDSRTSVGGGVAFELPALTAALPGGISGCPTVSVVAADVGDTNFLTIPVGVGFGTTLALGEAGLSLSPYVVPQARIRTGSDIDTDVSFLLSGGALVNITPSIYAGGTVNRVFIDTGNDSEFGLVVGVVF
jgi:hypothetical protein